MNTDFNRVIQKLCGAAICAALLTSTAIAREKPDPLGSARQVKTDVAGLNAPAQILVDVWGIPHIYAGNEHDLFFLQGFNAARDRLWVAMARESAHQLGTPLMSLTGWIDYLRENPGTPGSELVDHLEADAERLQRVAKRFERIGRPARREPVGLGIVAERVVAYFRPRLPTLAHSVTITLRSSGAGPTATGDPVLIEWALEVLVKNAIDALSGRGGRIEVEVEGGDSYGRVSVLDDGPGVPPDMQRQLFEPGVTSKAGGWGIGLALARRIVEQQHGGRISYHTAVPRGSIFVLQFPLTSK